MTLYLVRHGQTVMNRGGRFQGRTDSPLTEVGEAQAAAAAAALADSGATAVVTSPLQRAAQTAARIADELGVPVEVDDRLIEIDYGSWDGEPLSSVSAEEWARWRADSSFTPPGGESLEAVGSRAVACADELLRPNRTTIAVSHVSPIKAIVAWSLGGGVATTWRMFLDVASISAIDRRGSDPLLLSFNQPAGAAPGRKVALAMRRRHPLLKALGGAIVLIVIGGITGVMGVHAVQNMINENGKSRLARFTDGTDNPIVVTVGYPTAPISISLPAPPQSSHESMTFLQSVRQVDRVISPAGDDAVQVLWFTIASGMERDPESALKSLAAAETLSLGGARPLDARLVSVGTVAAYEFRVQPTGSTAVKAGYFVRVLMRGDVVYIVRVEAQSGGAPALAKVVKSIRWVQPVRS